MSHWMVEVVDKDNCWLKEPVCFDTKAEAKAYIDDYLKTKPQSRINLCRVTEEEYYGPQD